MAATGTALTASSGPLDTSNSSRRVDGGRGTGRGARGRGGAAGRGNGKRNQNGGASSMDGRSRGRERGRGGGKGRGQHNEAGPSAPATAAPNDQDPTTAQPPPQPGGPGVFGARLAKDAEANRAQGEKAQGSGSGAADGGDDVEAEVCFICASTVAHNSVAPCNHRTCHICALRLRALYKTKACAHCRTEAATVIFTDDAEKRYEDFAPEEFARTDGNLGIAYEKQVIFEDTVLLLRYNCPDTSCDVACMGWPDLHRHVRSVHQKVMCDLCTRNKKVFTHEHELFTQGELRKHERYGDDNPGAIDQSGFKGHPECGFCRKRFYGDDELFAHCRESHERCHLCDRRTGGQSPQYYMNYEALEQHFNKDHFPCLDDECLEKKFVVFDSEMDLKAHQLESHPNGLSKDARRDARRVDISAFDYRPQYQESARRGGRRSGRGRDPNSAPEPASSGGHMSRAEIAHQREREIQSAQSVTSRTFGGQLTRPEPQAQTVPRPAHAQSLRPAAAQPHLPSLNGSPNASAPASPPQTANLTPQEQARHLRHAAVTERAANLVGNDQVKLKEFRDRVSAYRSSAITASELIDSFFSMFDVPSGELGKLVKELADIFEIAAKRDTLLKSWSDWKAINEDYPSLPGPSGAKSSTAAGVLGAGIGSSRVLKLKSSTAQSSRSAIAGQHSWDSAAGGVNASARNPFPALSSPASAPSRPAASSSNWLALRPTATSSSASSSARPSPAPSRTQSSANVNSKDAFPSLPAAKKPTSTVFTPGYKGSGVIRQNNVSSGGNAWGGASAAAGNSTNQTTEPTTQEPEYEAVGKGKGKKGKKQVVFQWG